MAKNFEKLIFGGLHEKHAVQRGIWVPLNICSGTKENHGKPWSSLPVAGPSGCKLTSSQQSGVEWDPQHLTTLWASTARYGKNFIFLNLKFTLRFEFAINRRIICEFVIQTPGYGTLISYSWLRPLGRPRSRWLDNIKMDLVEVGWGDVDWIGLAQDRDRWRVLVNSVLNFRVA
jgi:hypothetical protein